MRAFGVLMFALLLVAARPAFAAVPQGPTNLLGTARAARIHLGWVDNANNETGYRIDRSTQSATAGYTQLAIVGANRRQYLDYAVVPGVAYFYRVRAYNSDGFSPQSRMSSSISLQAPPTPPNLTATLGVGRVTLRWNDASDDESHYAVERKQMPGGAFQVIAELSADSTSYIDDNVAVGSFRYRVRGRNGTLWGDYAGITARLDRPGSPTLTITRSAAGVSPAYIDLSWTAPAVGQYSGYRIERAVGPNDRAYRTLVERGPSATSYRDQSVEKNHNYFYRIVALNEDAGDSELSKIYATRARAEPPYPYVKMPALEQWKINFNDGSSTVAFVIPDIAVAQMLYQTYLRQIDFLNFYPHSAVAKAPIGEFVPCEWSGGGAGQEFMTAQGWFRFPNALWSVFSRGMAAEQSAWFTAYKMTQRYIERMKTTQAALTKDELLSLANVQSRSFAGRFLPQIAVEVDDWWYGDETFALLKETVPVFGEKARPTNPNTADQITLYTAEYIARELEASLRAHADLNYSHAPWLSGLTNPLSEEQIQALLTVRSSDLQIQRFENWFRKLPLPLYRGDLWIRFYAFAYCPLQQTTYSEWEQVEDGIVHGN